MKPENKSLRGHGIKDFRSYTRILTRHNNRENCCEKDLHRISQNNVEKTGEGKTSPKQFFHQLLGLEVTTTPEIKLI